MVETQSSVSGRMEGHGYYTAHSRAQRGFGELALRWLAQAAAEVTPPPAALPFVIADFGAAGGGSSLEPMRCALAARAAPGPVVVVHTDIPGNDFSALFQLVATAPDTYLGTPGVHAYAAGRSFYDRLFPDALLSLGWSSIAVHWLSRIDAAIPDHIYCAFATGEARAALEHRSAQDWLSFLGHRAHELRRTGRLIVLGGARADDGTSGAEGLMDAADAALRALVDAGALREHEYRRMTIPTYNRTMAEYLAPFGAGALDAGALDGRLEVRRSTLLTLPDPNYEGFTRDRDLDRYVDAVVGFFRAAFEQSLWASLDGDRDDAARAALRSGFAGQLGVRVAADPRGTASAWHVAMLDIAAP